MKEILLFITGVALFLFGMLKLSSGMQSVFSSRIRQYIRFSVKKPVYGLLIGLLSTITFQSSSATTLLAMGFVSAGLISFYQSLGIITRRRYRYNAHDPTRCLESNRHIAGPPLRRHHDIFLWKRTPENYR